MKTALKILGLIFFIAATILSCESPTTMPYDDNEFDDSCTDPGNLNELHNIRPTKPIRIPDTIAMRKLPTIIQITPDTTTTPQDSIPQEKLRIEN